jgi:hypothetical protein
MNKDQTLSETDNKILAEIDSYNTAQAVYHSASHGSKLETKALNKMREHMNTFDVAIKIYNTAPIDSELREKALEKMREYKPAITKLMLKEK